MYHLGRVSKRLTITVKHLSKVLGGRKTSEMPYVAVVVNIRVVDSVTVVIAVLVITVIVIVTVTVTVTVGEALFDDSTLP